MRKKTAIWVSVFLGLLVCAVLVYIPVSEAHKEQQYEEALSLYEDQFYDAAYDQFYPLREWKAEANAYAHICRARVLLSGRLRRAAAASGMMRMNTTPRTMMIRRTFTRIITMTSSTTTMPRITGTTTTMIDRIIAFVGIRMVW